MKKIELILTIIIWLSATIYLNICAAENYNKIQTTSYRTINE
jgi:hypothetical protein